MLQEARSSIIMVSINTSKMETKQKNKERLPKLRKIFQLQPGVLKDAARVTITDLREIKQRQKKYTETLYNRNYIQKILEDIPYLQ